MSTSTSLFPPTSRWWPEVAVATASIRPPRETYEVFAIGSLNGYIAAAQEGRLSNSLGPLLALSILADRRGLAGEELRVAISALGHALSKYGHEKAASELLTASIQAFVAGADYQSAADLAESVVILRLKG